jgi:hypothetical protein
MFTPGGILLAVIRRPAFKFCGCRRKPRGEAIKFRAVRKILEIGGFVKVNFSIGEENRHTRTRLRGFLRISREIEKYLRFNFKTKALNLQP